MKNQKLLKHYTLAGLLCLSLLSGSIPIFANSISVGRYLSVTEKPKIEQQHLLQQQIQIRFPQNILTIKQAIDFLLQFSGYHLSDMRTLSPPARQMLKQPLPEIDKNFGPMTIEQGLTTFTGNSFHLLVDPVHREIAFKLKTPYLKLYEKRSIKLQPKI